MFGLSLSCPPRDANKVSCQQSEEVRLLAVNLNTSLSFLVERRAAVKKCLNTQTS